MAKEIHTEIKLEINLSQDPTILILGVYTKDSTC